MFSPDQFQDAQDALATARRIVEVARDSDAAERTSGAGRKSVAAGHTTAVPMPLFDGDGNVLMPCITEIDSTQTSTTF